MEADSVSRVPKKTFWELMPSSLKMESFPEISEAAAAVCVSLKTFEL